MADPGRTERNKKYLWRIVWGLGLGGLLLLGSFLLLSNRLLVLAQEEAPWSEPVPLSASDLWSWFPDLAVDVYGTPHVVWCWTRPEEEGDGLIEQVMYSDLQGSTWQEPNDIVPPSADIIRNAITTDQSGNIHLLFGGSVYGIFNLYHQHAPVGEAWSAAAWSEPHLINEGLGYMGDIGVDSLGTIHVIHDDTRYEQLPNQRVVADIYYRNSTNGGRTWTPSHLLYESPLTGSARPYMEIDSDDVIHVTWDEGWDRLSGLTADRLYSVYVASRDHGQTWTEPKLIEYPITKTVQLAAGSDGEGGVMLVWRTMSKEHPRIYYQWSSDDGRTWQDPDTLPQIFARPWSNPHDMFDMATDSDGNIHLLAVGRSVLVEEALQGIYHLVWDGEQWSDPTRIFAQENLYPQYPKIVVHEGNQLHAAWFTWTGSVWEQDVPRVIWYSQRQISTPHQPVMPWPTETPEPTRSLASDLSPTPVPTPYPEFDREESGLPDGLRTESDELIQLIVALSPVMLIIVVLIVVRMSKSGRFFR